MQAQGIFKVKISPEEGTAIEKEAGVVRMTIDKEWSGNLSGHSIGAMLSSASGSTGAMAYVALEKFNGSLNGKEGSFYFTHSATMSKGNAASAKLKISVVANSGTGELTGLSGELTINIDLKGGHSYLFNYDLP